MAWYRREQRDLIETLRAAGPDAPTLCSPWRTRHLAAHLFLRLHEPWRLAKAGLSAERRDALTMAYGDDAVAAAGYEDLLERFAAPPRMLNPMGYAGEYTHLLEYVVHHEDVRRGGQAQPEPRLLPDAMTEELWDRVRAVGRLRARTFDGGVVLVVPGGRRAVVKKGRHSVAVSGSVIDLALWVTGRREAAEVELIAARSA